MFFRTPRFIRRFLRKNMNPLPEEKAWSLKKKLSVLYLVLAWHGAGIVLYMIFTGRKSWPESLGITNPNDDLIRPGKIIVFVCSFIAPRENRWKYK